MGQRSMHAVDAESEGQETFYRYGVYGITLRSQVPLSLSRPEDSSFSEIELRIGSSSLFSKALQGATLSADPAAWFQHAHLQDGSIYVRWRGLFEFLVSADGRQITCNWSNAASKESFEVYALGQALSFALVKRGFEPLHATSVVINGTAVAFLGSSGFGKSSLAACFLGAGDRLLTDDLLLFRENGKGFYGYPGPPRIKLFPRIAREFVTANLGGVPMNNGTQKLVLPLFENQVCPAAVPLKAIYVLNSPRNVFRKQRISIAQFHAREAFVILLTNTFNRLLADPARLQRQFAAATQLAAKVPAGMISYPRVLASLPQVRELILSEM
jgi:hypothetical protein